METEKKEKPFQTAIRLYKEYKAARDRKNETENEYLKVCKDASDLIEEFETILVKARDENNLLKVKESLKESFSKRYDPLYERSIMLYELYKLAHSDFVSANEKFFHENVNVGKKTKTYEQIYDSYKNRKERREQDKYNAALSIRIADSELNKSCRACRNMIKANKSYYQENDNICRFNSLVRKGTMNLQSKTYELESKKWEKAQRLFWKSLEEIGENCEVCKSWLKAKSAYKLYRES